MTSVNMTNITTTMEPNATSDSHPDLNMTKGLCLFLLLVDTMIFGYPVYFLVRSKNNTPRSAKIRGIVISYLNCFAGGVFLGACLLHLLAEGREDMEKYLKNANLDIEFPLYETAVSVGFFLIAFVEQIAHQFLQHPGDEKPGKDKRSHSASKSSDGIVLKQITSTEPYGQSRAEDNKAFTKDSSKATNGNGKTAAPSSNGETSCEVVVTSDEICDEVPEYMKAMEGNPLKAFLLLGALSFHTVFDGLAIGLQNTETRVWEIFVAIVIHKSLVAVCLGLQLFLVYRSKPSRAFGWIFFFALIAPLGVGIAMILTAGDMDLLAEQLASWILQGMATGTFFYVTFFEILKDELTQKGGILKIFVIIIGFAGMAVAKLLD